MDTVIATSFTRGSALFGLLALCTFPAAAAADPAASGGLAAAAPEAPAAASEAVPPTAADVTGIAAPAAAAPSVAVAGVGSWNAPAATDLGRPVRVSGRFRPDLAGRTVRLQRRTPANRWLTAATARIRTTGTFTVSWRTRSARYHELRVVLNAARGSAHTVVPTADADAAGASQAPETARVAVLQRARATWFGPGFYGTKTACGLILRESTEGIAHRTLPCGTRVEVRMGSRTAVLPVIDRGPFANGADFDLTKNVADEIGLDGVATIRFAQRADLARLVTPAQSPAIFR